MTLIDLKLELPENLARDAEAAGLLSPRALRRLLREGVRREAVRRLAEGAERVRRAGIPPLSMAEIQEEVSAVRKARRAAARNAA
jgi:hypothetical protein